MMPALTTTRFELKTGQQQGTARYNGHLDKAGTTAVDRTVLSMRE
jgi:hypothetical protein